MFDELNRLAPGSPDMVELAHKLSSKLEKSACAKDI